MYNCYLIIVNNRSSSTINDCPLTRKQNCIPSKIASHPEQLPILVEVRIIFFVIFWFVPGIKFSSLIFTSRYDLRYLSSSSFRFLGLIGISFSLFFFFFFTKNCVSVNSCHVARAMHLADVFDFTPDTYFNRRNGRSKQVVGGGCLPVTRI